MYLEAVFRFYVLLNHFVGHFFFGLVRFGSFSNTIYRNLALALSKLHINVDITVGFFVGQKNYRLIVMYLGQIVEEADVLTLFDHPCHPYTEGLMRSIPRMEGDRTKPLYMIPGTVPLLSQIPTGCRFAPRCAYATERCRQETPQLTPVSDKQSVRCFRAAELAQKEANAQ